MKPVMYEHCIVIGACGLVDMIFTRKHVSKRRFASDTQQQHRTKHRNHTGVVTDGIPIFIYGRTIIKYVVYVFLK